MAVKVIKPGLSTTVQDLGRPGYYHIGIPLSGGMDRLSLIARPTCLSATRKVPPFLKPSSWDRN